MFIYIIVIDSAVHKEAYSSLEKARDFILSRADKPKPFYKDTWQFLSDFHAYYIKELEVK